MPFYFLLPTSVLSFAKLVLQPSSVFILEKDKNNNKKTFAMLLFHLGCIYFCILKVFLKKFNLI